uniref:Lipase 1 n=1 Tax=Cacopsylla melanoneura TaxID=428564 RepID=A0A8D8RT47_9HEMI
MSTITDLFVNQWYFSQINENMILRAQGGSKVGRIWITLCLMVLIILVQTDASNSGKGAVNDEHTTNDTSAESIDTLFDHDYLKNFLEPASRTIRSNSMASWHMKEMDSVLKLWNKSGQEFKIITEDGYILSLFRITATSPPNKERPLTPILLLHGFLAAPEIFLTRGKEDLAIILSEAGYDVWLGSYRGGYYGRRHVKLTTEDEQFWDFSFHEHGVYDVPAMIDHIIQVTKTPRVSCIGHSMGNAVFLVMLAMRPEYNDKVQMFAGLGPFAVAHTEMDPLTRLLLPKILEMVKFNKNTESRDLFRRRQINPLVGPCWSLPTTCLAFLTLFLGKNNDHGACANLMPVVVGYFPSGTSNNNFQHILSLRDGNFAQFDYGTSEGNLAHYNRTSPPEYNLTRVRIPISLYYGGTDSVSSTKGMNAQVRALPNVIKASIIAGYNHMDFILASNARQALYENILEDLNKPYTKPRLPDTKVTGYNLKDFKKEAINSLVIDAMNKTKSEFNHLMKNKTTALKTEINTKIKDINADTKVKLEDIKSKLEKRRTRNRPIQNPS